MSRVLLKKLKIKNLGPIKEDEISFNNFTFFVGRNNAGKSHYLKAVELLLSSGIKKEQIAKWQHNKEKPIEIEGEFTGVGNFTSLVTVSNHKQAIDDAIQNEILRVVSKLDSENGAQLGIINKKGEVHNPGGFSGNLLKVLPEVISIPATADTVQELADKSTTTLGKLKKEVMGAFFQDLAGKTKTLLADLDSFLHSQEEGVRANAISDFEKGLKEEFSFCDFRLACGKRKPASVILKINIIKINVYLLAKNVWCEDTKTMASASMTGATTLTYTAGDPLYVGAYAADQKADGTHFSGVPVQALVTGSNTIASLVVDHPSTAFCAYCCKIRED